MKKYCFVLFPILFSTTAFAGVPWSQQAHEDLIRQAFPEERADCIARLNAGSAWVDSLVNQGPSHSFMHAMRSSDQTLEEAKSQMADYIQRDFELAKALYDSSTQQIDATPDDPMAQFTPDGRLITNMENYLQSCEHRGRGLHPVMDSTSPAHANFAVWSITDLGEILQHGDMPNSIENERALFANPDLMKKTVALMLVVQKMYIDLGIFDFRFE